MFTLGLIQYIEAYSRSKMLSSHVRAHFSRALGDKVNVSSMDK